MKAFLAIALSIVAEVTARDVVVRCESPIDVSLDGGRTWRMLDAGEQLLAPHPTRLSVVFLPVVSPALDAGLPAFEIRGDGVRIERPSLLYRRFDFEIAGAVDQDGDGDSGTDADIEVFFAVLSDFNRDGDVGTDADIEAFFRALAGQE